MDPSEYQRLAARTEADSLPALRRISKCVFSSPEKVNLQPARLLHAALGLSDESGEFAKAMKKWLWYGEKPDWTNFKEEIGDCLWYLALACNALEIDMGEVMEANIRKLRSRYPHLFDDVLAKEESRDREQEREAMDGNSQGLVKITEGPDGRRAICKLCKRRHGDWDTGICEFCQSDAERAHLLTRAAVDAGTQRAD